jgi:hypothetical protein
MGTAALRNARSNARATSREDVKRSLPRLAKRSRSLLETEADGFGLPSSMMLSGTPGRGP